MALNRNPLLAAALAEVLSIKEDQIKDKKEQEEKNTKAIEGWLATTHSSLTMKHLLKLISEAGQIAVRSGERLILEVTLRPRPKAKSVNVHYKAHVGEAG